MKMHEKTWRMTVLAMFSAIIILLAFTPLGFIPLPLIRGTTVHIPVIVGSLLLGPKAGAVLGFMFGLTSLYINSVTPTLTSFVFSPFFNLPGQDSGSLLSLIIVFVPRILVGVVPWYVSIGIKKITNEKYMPTNWAISAVAGSLTNTLLVMHFIFIFFGEDWARIREVETSVYTAILGVIAGNGIPEATGAAIIVVALMGALTAARRVQAGVKQ